MSGQVLKLALRANALFSIASGVALALFGNAAARMALATPGPGGAWAFRGVGVLLAAYAVWLVALSRRPAERPADVLAVVLGDVAWVAGSLGWVAIAPHTLTPTGRMLVEGVAAVIGAFALAQGLALATSRTRAGRPA